MRAKTKIKLITLVIMLIILGICGVIMLGKNTQTQKAYAAENNSEYEAYGYTTYVRSVSFGSSTSGGYWGTPGLFKIMFYTEDFFGFGGKLNDGVLLNWRKGGFYMDSNGPVQIMKINIKKDGNYFASNFYSGSFYDGNYSFKIVLESRESQNILWTYTYTYSFVIDNTPPRTTLTANGIYVGNNACTNGVINFSATDTRFKYIYYRRPYSSYSTYGGANFAVAATESNNGLWGFYAEDMANNRSTTLTIYLDTIKPVGRITSDEAIVQSGGYTKEAFSYTATDTSGSVTHQYKPPQSNTWINYVSGMVISENSGLHTFRSTDRAGNISEVSTIFLDSTAPQGMLFAGTKAVSSGTKTNASYISFSATDNSSGIRDVFVKLPNSNTYSSYISGS